ncbi:hypothetical protein CROQUDRAFT_105186 [Cronartium quercuum f. sp. fusiforme G11]|uniref:Uncharacterized protein n=1 Tax=Cronartium quercuum f. sp. fusiforme G11 TaxID=708437 RepID=A0A9P6NLH6_9BASI|nr:hypothetical protein CROQUDRAFT_105186 [Cronartium quercuum f. sp. fusiforme G11]
MSSSQNGRPLNFKLWEAERVDAVKTDLAGDQVVGMMIESSVPVAIVRKFKDVDSARDALADDIRSYIASIDKKIDELDAKRFGRHGSF